MLYLKTKLRQFKWYYHNRESLKRAGDISNAKIFSRIYAENEWGKTHNSGRANTFFSGSGSHDPEVVSDYIKVVSQWVNSIDAELSALDIGCGDFNVGSKLVPYFNHYTAADVVPELIEYNKKKWNETNLDFTVLDITADHIPKYDVIFTKEVFQHLSNNDICKSLNNISGSCKYLVVTESRPGNAEFVANLDKPTGVGTRSQFESGVDLLKPPFSMQCKTSDVVLSQRRGTRRLDTIIYELA